MRIGTNSIKSIGISLALFAGLVSVFPGYAREVRLGYYAYGEFHAQSADGSRAGFGYEAFEILAKRAGWQSRYAGCGRPWSEMAGLVASNEVDVLDCVRKTPEREAIYDFSELPMGYSYAFLLVRADEMRYVAGDYAKWGKVRVGTVSGGCVSEEFENIALLRGVEIDWHEFRTDAEALAALRSGGLDMAVVETMFFNRSGDLRILGEFRPQPCYFCVKKGNRELLGEIDRAMAAIYEENPAWYIELRRRCCPVRDAVVYLPRTHLDDERFLRYLKGVSALLAAIGDWNPVLRPCAADFSDADFSEPSIVANVKRTAENLQRFDFPYVHTCRRPIYLAGRSEDGRFANGIQKDSGVLRIGYDRSEPEWLECFREHAMHRKISYSLVPFGSVDDLGLGVKTQAVDLAVFGLDPGDGLRRIESCGSVEFDFATPKEQSALRAKLDLCSRAMRYHDGEALRRLEQCAFGISDTRRVVRAGVYEEPGAIDIAADGRITGFVAEYLRGIAHNRKWDLVFVPMSYNEVMKCLVAGEIDIAGISSPGLEPSQSYYIAKRDIGVVRYALKVRTDSPLQPNRPDLWNGNAIGFLEGSRPYTELWRYLDSIGAKCRFVPYRSMEDAVADVENGKLDGIYSLHSRESGKFRTIAVFPSVHSYLCISRKRLDLKREADMAMDYFASNNIDFNWVLNNFYLKGSREVMMLDADEIAYVTANRGRKVVVALPETVDPVAHFDEETGSARGFLVALFREIAAKSGLEIEFTGKGRADVYVTQRESMDDRNDLIRDREWYPLPSVRISLADGLIPDAARGIWAVESKRVDEIAYLRQCNYEVLACDTREDCYRAVANGRAEATIDNFGTARLMLDEHREFKALHNSRIDPSQWARQVSLAFSPEAAPELRSILIKSRVTISPSAAEKMFVDAIVECRQGRFSREDLIHYGSIIGCIVVVLLVFGYALMYIKRQQDSAKARTQFFFNVSHDVRTPIHAIMGFVDIGLSSLNDPVRVRECFMKTKEAGSLLMSLIQSVLDMSRLESGKVRLSESVGDVRLSFVNIETTMQELAHEKGVQLSFGFGDIRDRFVFADYEVCSRIFVNIITNAIKYTPAGGKVEVKCEQAGGDEESGIKNGKWRNCSSSDYSCYRYTFRDTGIGMSEKYRSHLYEMFSREKNTTMSGVSGLGLGMAICKSFVDLAGGRIDCESRPGEGTVFTVELPFRLQEGRKYIDPMSGEEKEWTGETDGRTASGLQQEKTASGQQQVKTASAQTAAAPEAPKPAPQAEAPKPMPQAEAPKPYAGKQALLVDDSKLNREVARHYLRSAGFEVETAENGQEAVDKACAGTDGVPYDVILMDIQMPVMDGYEATRAIRDWEKRKNEGRHHHVPIIAWTANAFDDDRAKALSMGMDGHVAKGIKINVLMETLARFVPGA